MQGTRMIAKKTEIAPWLPSFFRFIQAPSVDEARDLIHSALDLFDILHDLAAALHIVLHRRNVAHELRRVADGLGDGDLVMERDGLEREDQPDGQRDVKAALQELYRQSQALVIVTMGAEGCMAYDGSCFVCERAVPCDIIDTIGAGDAHAGACLHALEQGMDLKQMLQQAAGIASRALHMHGSLKAK